MIWTTTFTIYGKYHNTNIDVWFFLIIPVFARIY